MATRYIQSFSICDSEAEINSLPLSVGTAYCQETHCWYDSTGGAWHKTLPGDVSGLATAAQGTKADTAVQPASLAPVAFSGVYNDLFSKPTLGTAAAQNIGAFATSAQGAKADTALQSQVNADWNAGSGTAQVLNKPALGSAALQNTGAFATAAQGTKADNAAVASTVAAALAGKATLISYYNSGGTISAVVKKWIGIVTPSTSNGYSIDISSAGFSQILNAQVIAIRNTATVTSSPNVSIKSISTTAIVVNVTEGNALTQVIFGATVLLGVPLVFANVTGLTLQVCVEGI